MFLKIYNSIYYPVTDTLKHFVIIVSFVLTAIITVRFIQWTYWGFWVESLIMIGTPVAIPFITIQWFRYVFSFMKPRPVEKKRRRHISHKQSD
jgi:hypothetical protein